MPAQIDLNDVRTFAIAAQTKTLSGAASALQKPVSTVSRSLTRLEKQLGILLVHRSSRGLALTEAGTDYLASCRSALRTLKDGEDLLQARQQRPSGTLKIMTPITMARDLFAPLLKGFVTRFPDLRLEIETYSSGFDQEPQDGVDVFFKVLAPKDSLKRVRSFPGIRRGLFASPDYVREAGAPAHPQDLPAHRCAGFGAWILSSGRDQVVTLNPSFHIVSSDHPGVNLRFALDGLGITLLPLYIAHRADHGDKLVRILPQWQPDPLRICALFVGSSRLTPKIQALLDFLAEYIGTDLDPRGHGRKKAFWTHQSADRTGPL
jgi:DNA-binding transcriptional LysR family regulator